jgi:hypothetical protein
MDPMMSGQAKDIQLANSAASAAPGDILAPARMATGTTPIADCALGHPSADTSQVEHSGTRKRALMRNVCVSSAVAVGNGRMSGDEESRE